MRKVPICIGLTKVATIAGIPREAFIFNSCLALIFILVLEAPWLTILNIINHIVLFLISKRDSQTLNIFFKKYIKQKEYYYEG